MADEEAKKNAAQWRLVILIVSAIFAALIILAYATNEYKRNGPENNNNPLGINGKG